MSEWQPIESAPKTGEHILGLINVKNENNGLNCEDYAPNGLYICEIWFGRNSWEDRNFFDLNPISWMPLPEKPVKKHECVFDNARCVEDDSGNLLFAKKDCIHVVRFCPFCGEKADG